MDETFEAMGRWMRINSNNLKEILKRKLNNSKIHNSSLKQTSVYIYIIRDKPL